MHNNFFAIQSIEKQMKRIYLFLLISSVLLTFSACQKEDDLRSESVVTTQKVYQNDLDKWIYENLTKPYNVEVKYKWEANEITNKFRVTPPKLEKVKEFLDAYLNIWIKPYEEESKAGGNPDFLYKYMPKLLVLVGTPAYNEDGTSTMGLAEGGRKVVIFDIDNFGNAEIGLMDTPEKILKKKRNVLYVAFHVLHHEFAHILHQTKFYPNEFKEISKADYTARWMDLSEADAQTLGCITPYSLSNENEDFVEIASGMLDCSRHSNVPYTIEYPLKDAKGNFTNVMGNVTGSEWELFLYSYMMDWDFDSNWNTRYFRTPEATVGYHKFLSKVNIVTTYYKEKWGVDIYSLQKRIDTAVINFVK